jgi:hypothetical protein
MSRKKNTAASSPEARPPVQGLKYLRRVFHVLERLAPSGTERDRAGNRRLFLDQYAGLVLLSLFNANWQSVRAISELSSLKKVQRRLGGGRVSVGSLSESARIFDPSLLEEIFHELWEALPPLPHRSSGTIPDELVRRLTAVDGTALRALPQMVSAAAGTGKWRLHLQFEVHRAIPERATLTADEVGGVADERAVLARSLRPDRVYIMDRGYERYALLEQIVRQGSDYVCRVQQRSLEIIEASPLSREAREAGIQSDEQVVLGRSRPEIGSVTHPVRRLVIHETTPGRQRSDRPQSEELVLLTSLVDVPAEWIAAIYRLRWAIELFFRFFKHVLGCRHLISQKPEGIAIQVYCALIAALLLSHTLGLSLGKHGFLLVSLYLQGLADEDEFLAGLERLKRSKTKSND